MFAGRIIVAQDSQRTDAVQRSDNLLLSRLAEADSPSGTRDLRRRRGSARRHRRQIDENALFYLRTRGIDEVHARKLLTLRLQPRKSSSASTTTALRKHARTACSPAAGGAALEELLCPARPSRFRHGPEPPA
ncbi:SufD family Fe-S cluster assembly protein [Thauera humireducens]|uniref:SufD family Fe-S cluster assembly protein n=1 Tax=Thauera humireducens TaxID=1134435 RepID=UPI003C717BCA